MAIKNFLSNSNLKTYILSNTNYELNQNEIFYKVKENNDKSNFINKIDDFNIEILNYKFNLDKKNIVLLYNIYNEIDSVKSILFKEEGIIYFDYYKVKDIAIFKILFEKSINLLLICIKISINYIIKNTEKKFKIKIFNLDFHNRENINNISETTVFKLWGKFIFNSKIDCVINNQNNIIKNTNDKNLYNDFENYKNEFKINEFKKDKIFNYEFIKQNYISLIIIEYYCENCRILKILYLFNSIDLCTKCNKIFNKLEETTMLLNKMEFILNNGEKLNLYINVNNLKNLNYDLNFILEGFKVDIDFNEILIVNNIYIKNKLYDDFSIDYGILTNYIQNKKNIIEEIINYIDDNWSKSLKILIICILINSLNYNIILNIYDINKKVAENIKNKLKCFKSLFLIYNKSVNYVVDITRINKSMILFSDIKLKTYEKNIIQAEYLKNDNKKPKLNYVNSTNFENYISIIESIKENTSKNFNNTNNYLNKFIFNSIHKLFDGIYNKNKILEIFNNISNDNFQYKENTELTSENDNSISINQNLINDDSNSYNGTMNNYNKLNLKQQCSNSLNVNINKKTEYYKLVSKNKLLTLIEDILNDNSNEILNLNNFKEIFDVYILSIKKHYNNVENFLFYLNQKGYIIKLNNKQFKIIN